MLVLKCPNVVFPGLAVIVVKESRTGVIGVVRSALHLEVLLEAALCLPKALRPRARHRRCLLGAALLVAALGVA